MFTHFKDTNGNTYSLETAFLAESLPSIPADVVEISQEEMLELTKPTPEQIETAVRAKRAALLASCDWTQLGDVPEVTREKWAGYRQALRDMTKQKGFPGAVGWPVPPV